MPLFTPAPAPPIISNDAVGFSGASTNNATAAIVYLYPFELPSPVTITACRWRNGATPSGHTNMAIYDANGNIVPGSDTGPQTNVATTETTFTYASPFGIGQGSWYMALACETTDAYLSSSLAATIVPITRARKATNQLASGAMPLTTGALSGAAFTPAMAFLRQGGLS